MTCDFRGCLHLATTALRMGDGTHRRFPGDHGYRAKIRQTFVRYCDDHLATVHGLFVTCDEKPLLELEAGPAGGGIRMRR